MDRRAIWRWSFTGCSRDELTTNFGNIGWIKQKGLDKAVWKQLIFSPRIHVLKDKALNRVARNLYVFLKKYTRWVLFLPTFQLLFNFQYNFGIYFYGAYACTWLKPFKLLYCSIGEIKISEKTRTNAIKTFNLRIASFHLLSTLLTSSTKSRSFTELI